VFKNVFLKASNILHWLPQVRAAVFIGIGSNLCLDDYRHCFLNATREFQKISLLCFNLDVSQFCFDFGKTILNY
jgi:hypothetical protein